MIQLLLTILKPFPENVCTFADEPNPLLFVIEVKPLLLVIKPLTLLLTKPLLLLMTVFDVGLKLLLLFAIEFAPLLFVTMTVGKYR
jgi:hypothetical protein